MKKIYTAFYLILILMLNYSVVWSQDDCATAVNINGMLDCPATSGFISGTTVGATPDNIPFSCIGDETTDIGVWFRFTAIGTDIQISDNLGTDPFAVIMTNPACAGPITEYACEQLPFRKHNLLSPGTEYYIMIFYPAAATGTFDLCVHNFNPPPNDDCLDAIDISGSLECPMTSSVMGTTINATADSLIGTSCIDENVDPGVWYKFTAIGADIDISFNSGANLYVMLGTWATDCDGTFSYILCDNQDPYFLDNALTIGDEYYLRVMSENGTEEDFDLCVNNYPPPSNDLPCDATILTSNVTLTENTFGAFGDFTSTNCDPLQEYVNTLHYQYTVPSAVFKLSLDVLSSELQGPLSIYMYQDCNNPILIEEFCDEALSFRGVDICVFPDSTYYFLIGTHEDDNGEFQIVLRDQVPGQCDEYEICDYSEDLGIIASDCEEVVLEECNTEACPDPYIFGSCDLSVGATVWYSFTTDFAADILNMYIDGSDFDDLQFVFVDACDFSGDNYCIETVGGVAEFLQQPIMPLTTYYFGVTDPGGDGGNYVIHLEIYPDIPYDDPCLPLLLPEGVTATSNDCTTEDDPIFRFTNCPLDLLEATAWYEIIVPQDADALNVMVINDGADPLPSNVLIQYGALAAGQACAPEIFTPIDEQCTGLGDPYEFEIKCFPIADTIKYYILIGTELENTGDYNIDVDFIYTDCTVNDSCQNAVIMMPISPPDDAAPPEPECYTGCMDYNCPEPLIVNGCSLTDFEVVWMEVLVDDYADVMNIQLTTDGWTPAIMVFQGTCDALMTLPDEDCQVGAPGSLVYNGIAVDGPASYWIAIANQGPNDVEIGNGDYEICITTHPDYAECSVNQSLEIIARSNDPDGSLGLSLEGPFCPGESVTVRYELDFDPTQTACQWFQGMVPKFGNGWDVENFNPSAYMPSPSGGATWDWYPDGSVLYQEPNPFLCTYMLDSLYLCHPTYEIGCPCTPGFPTGEPLPGGWFAYSPGGLAQCTNTGHPNTGYGVPQGCNVITHFTQEFEISVKQFDYQDDCLAASDLTITMYPFADGETGCWSDNKCAGDIPEVKTYGVSCEIVGIAPIDPISICSGDFADFEFVTDPTNVWIQITATGDAYVSGYSDSDDPEIVQQLINTHPDLEPQDVIYRAIAKTHIDAVCESDTTEVIVTVYAEIEVEQDEDPLPYVCFDELTTINLSEYVQGGSGIYSYNWTNDRGDMGSEPIISSILDPGLITYSVTVTDDVGCETIGEIEVEVIEELTVDIFGDPEICEDSIPTILSVTAIGGSGEYVDYTWSTPNGSFSGPDSTLEAFETGSYFVSVTDDKGCTSTASFQFTVLERPEPGILVFPTNQRVCLYGPPTQVFLQPFHPTQTYNGDFYYSWEAPPGFTGAIGNASTFETTVPGIYYVTVTDDNGCFTPDSIVLVEEPAPLAIPDTLSACYSESGISIFDLTSIEQQVNNGTDNLIYWFADSMLMVAIGDPANYESEQGVVYAQIEDTETGCLSLPAEIVLSFKDQILGNDFAIDLCDQGQALTFIDLTSFGDSISNTNGAIIEWFEDSLFTSPVVRPDSLVTTSDTFYARLSYEGCDSDPYELIVDVSILLNSQTDTLMECIEVDGMGTFNLTEADVNNNPGTGYTISWFSDPNLNTPIANPMNYRANTSLVYAQILNSEGCIAPIAEVQLVTEILLTAYPAADSVCMEIDGMGTFDLTELNQTVTGLLALDVVWFSDAAGMNVINDPTLFRTAATTVYATVSDGTCAANIAPIDLSLYIDVIAFPDTLQACDRGGGVGNFNLESAESIVSGGNGDSVLWFSNISPRISISDPADYMGTQGPVYAILKDGPCVSEAVEVFLKVEEYLESFTPDPLEACELLTGEGNFNLTVRDNDVKGSGNEHRDVIWYTDEAGTNVIDPANDYTALPGSVWAIVWEDGCRSLAVELILTVSADLPSGPGNLIACDEGGDIGTFNLHDADLQVSDNNPSFTVRYYLDDAGTQEIISPQLENFVSGDQIIYAIAFDGDCRSVIQLVQLEVEIQVFPTTNLVLTECNEGGDIGTFSLDDAMLDLHEDATEVIWFEQVGSSTPIGNSSAYQSGDNTIFAVVKVADCVSDTVPVRLEVETIYTAGDAFIETCDEGSGTGTFDLTKYTDAVTNNSSTLSVEWYEDSGLSIPILPPTAFVTDSGTIIYAIIIDVNGCVSDPRPYLLSVTNNLTVVPTTIRACRNNDNTGDFNLNSAITIINDNLGYDVEFYLDIDLTMPIDPNTTSSYNSPEGIIYAITIDGLCISMPVEIILEFRDDIVANPLSETLCDEGDGTATFDLAGLESGIDNGEGLQVLWYEDQQLNIPYVNSTIKTGSTSLWAVLTDGNCDSEPVEIMLNVTTVESIATAMERCDEGTGTGTFNLTTVESIIDPTGIYEVLWYEDAAGAIAITDITAFVSGEATIYARVFDGTCYSLLVPVELSLTNDLAAFDGSMMLCDDGDGEVIFDLTLISSDINGGNGLDVVFYSDAGGQNIISNASTYLSASAGIFAQVVDGACRSAIVAVDLTVAPLPVADAGDDKMITCRDEFIELVGANTPIGTEYSYAWSTSDGNILSGVDARAAEVDQPGTYTLLVTNTTTGCERADEVIVSRNVELPIVNAGPDRHITCIQFSVEIGTDQTEIGSTIVLNWSRNGSDISMSARSFTTDQEGIYVLHSENTETGCENSDTVEVFNDVDILVDPVLDLRAPNCNGANTGCIELISVSGGQTPYSYSINGNTFVSNEPICSLGAGNYTVTIRDVNGCELIIDAVIAQPVPLIVQLIGPAVIDWGDTAQIFAHVIPENTIVDTVLWDTENLILTDVDTIIRATGLSAFPVSVILYDENGCRAMDNIIVYVKKNFKVFAPSAFSPFSSPGTNDHFMLFGSPDIVTSVDLLQVYTRWGEKVFERTDLTINDEQAGWDGYWRGDKLLPGIYVYYAEVTFVDGSKEEVKGDVMLLD
jgi:hypothetical protein